MISNSLVSTNYRERGLNELFISIFLSLSLSLSQSINIYIYIYIYIYIVGGLCVCVHHIYPNPPIEQDMTQGQFLVEFNGFEFRVFLLLD